MKRSASLRASLTVTAKVAAKHTGAPAACLAVYSHEQVTFDGVARKVYAPSPGVGRAFCPDCGTSMTWETDLRGYGPVCAIHISTFDDPALLPPSCHSFYAEKIDWFDIADQLPRFAGFVVDGDIVSVGPRS